MLFAHALHVCDIFMGYVIELDKENMDPFNANLKKSKYCYN